MSEQINKVLASTAQAFSTAQQKQARDNISAQAKISYSYSGSTITAIDGSAVGLNAVSANNCISGDGTSSSPLGISSKIQLNGGTASAEYTPSGVKMSATPYTSTNYRVAGWNILSTGSNTNSRSCGANCSGIEINWDTNYYVMRISASGIEAMDAWTPSLHCAWYNYNGAQHSSYDGKTSIWNDHELIFKHSASGAWRTVDIDSIDRWNSYSANQAGWNESGNSLSTGFGGNPVTAASQYNEGAGNWAARTVKISGLPDQTMYGFQTKPAGTATYGVNQAGAFVAIPQSNYFTYLFHETGATVHTFDTEIFPTGLTANARLDFVNLCSAASANVKMDTFHGTTAAIKPGESATMWYIATADIWTDGHDPVPV